MTPFRRLKTGDLDLTIADPFDRDIIYIYDEIFVGRAYEHPSIRLGDNAVIMDVGANVGLFSIWASQTYKPANILAYEASPTTHRCCAENIARHIPAGTTTAQAFHRAVSEAPGRELTLNQPPWNSGLSTMLDGSKLAWVEELRQKGELLTHRVESTSVTHEIESRRLDRVDLLKIDVEGYFMEVLAGITDAAYRRIGNIVLEAEYTDTLGHSIDSLKVLLRSKGYVAETKDAAQVMIYAWRT